MADILDVDFDRQAPFKLDINLHSYAGNKALIDRTPVDKTIAIVERVLNGSAIKAYSLIDKERSNIKPLDSGYQVEAGIVAEFGGGEPTKIKGKVQGEIHDGQGGYVRGEIQTDQKGKTKIEASGGKEKR